jgi:hypothetical protein
MNKIILNRYSEKTLNFIMYLPFFIFLSVLLFLPSFSNGEGNAPASSDWESFTAN